MIKTLSFYKINKITWNKSKVSIDNSEKFNFGIRKSCEANKDVLCVLTIR